MVRNSNTQNPPVLIRPYDTGKYITYDIRYINSQESPKMEEIFRDFDWDLNRFVEYRSLFTRKETLPIKNPL